MLVSSKLISNKTSNRGEKREGELIQIFIVTDDIWFVYT
jgi:hypothetical protein